MEKRNSKKYDANNILRCVAHEDIRKTYKFGEVLGEGSYGQVRYATRHNIPGEQLVVKSIPN